MFVDHTSDVDGSGVETPHFARVSTVEVEPAKGTVYSNDLYANLGNLPDSTMTAPVTLPDVAGTTARSKYTVAVAGPGVTAGDSYVLSSSEQADLAKLYKKTFFVDFLIPALGRVLVANTLEHMSPSGQKLLFTEMEDQATSQQDSIASFVDRYFPQAEANIEAGDFKTALKTAIAGTWKNSAAQTAIATFFANFMKAIPDFPGKPDGNRYASILDWINKAIEMDSASSVVYGVIDDLPQGRDWNQSAKMQTWDIEVDKAKVTFTPISSTIHASGTDTFVKLTANVTNIGSLPKGTTVSYKYTTPGVHGTLSLAGGGGQATITTAQNYVFYSAGVGVTATYGDEPVTLEVFLDHGGGNLEKVGGAKATVKVVAQSDITLIPAVQSIHPGDTSQSIVAETHYPDLLSSGELELKWSLKKGLGKLSVGSDPTSEQSVTFTAGQTEGVETVQCDIVETASGNTLSSATADVKIERKTSIFYGSVFASGKVSENDALGCTGYGGVGIRFPKVAGAKNYSVHCYNFNDTAYFGTDIRTGCDAAGNGASFDIAEDGTVLTTKGADGSFYIGLTGGTFGGPGPCGPDTDPNAGWHDAARRRFGGMIVEVTVTY